MWNHSRYNLSHLWMQKMSSCECETILDRPQCKTILDITYDIYEGKNVSIQVRNYSWSVRMWNRSWYNLWHLSTNAQMCPCKWETILDLHKCDTILDINLWHLRMQNCVHASAKLFSMTILFVNAEIVSAEVWNCSLIIHSHSPSNITICLELKPHSNPIYAKIYFFYIY